MWSIRSQHGAKFCDTRTRRELLRAGSLGLGGLTLASLLRLQEAAGGAARSKAVGRARSVVVLFLSGGPSHLDMWDLKPDAPEEIRGTFRPVATSVPGVQISEHMPRSARMADRFTLVRSMRHGNSNHPAASYWMMTGGPIARTAPQAVTLSREDRPHPGAVLSKLQGGAGAVPPFVMLPEMISPVGPPRPGQHAGFLGSAFDPYLVSSDPNLPDFSAGALAPLAEVTTDRLVDRRALLGVIDRQAKHLGTSAAAESLDPYYTRAFDIVASAAAQRAFDVAAESDRTRERYGRHVFGQSVLVARRLVEAGVRLVQVNWVRHDNGKGGQGYDSHRDHLNWAKTELLPPTDAAFAALVEDLDAAGLLDETLVVMMGEFGRTPRFNSNGGRDHWSQCFSAVLAGGGVRRGHVHGESDKIGAYPTSSPVTPDELLATIYHCVGLDPHATLRDLQNRPHTLADATPVGELLA
jgi:hypothetical protein